MILHLLRPFTEWQSGPTVEAAAEWIESLPDDGHFSTTTSRCPKRVRQLERGSVYFCRSGHTLFRMPFVGVQPTMFGEFDILMRCELIRVEPKHVGMVRGWRYLRDDVKPADIVDDLPPGLDPNEIGI